VNANVKEVTYNLVGNNMLAYAMNLAYANTDYSHEKLTLGKDYKMYNSDNITYIYVGSVSTDQ